MMMVLERVHMGFEDLELIPLKLSHWAYLLQNLHVHPAWTLLEYSKYYLETKKEKFLRMNIMTSVSDYMVARCPEKVFQCGAKNPK